MSSVELTELRNSYFALRTSPPAVIELKKPGVPARTAFDENLTHYKQQIPALFWFNAPLE